MNHKRNKEKQKAQSKMVGAGKRNALARSATKAPKVKKT